MKKNWTTNCKGQTKTNKNIPTPEKKGKCTAHGPFRWKGAIQKDLDKLKQWAHGKLMNFKKTRCKVLHPGWDKLWYQHRLGGEQQPWWEGHGNAAGWETDYGPAMVHSAQNAKRPGLHQKQHWQQGEGGYSARLLFSGEQSPGLLCPALGPPA